MKVKTMAGIRTLNGEPPRSTAYYYADLERLKRQNAQQDGALNSEQDGGQTNDDARPNPNELSEYVESNEVINDGAIREVPPLRDRRQRSLPEYRTPEPFRKITEETYSTAGTFPMPEPKEKEPLLAELEIVGRLPLTQLDSGSGVRRSRSWYLCCPNVEEEVSRESSWRYSSMRPVTAPPAPGTNGLSVLATHSSERGPCEDAAQVRAERDALARALAAERHRAAAAARAHDARLAELHGVIAELVRRRAADSHARGIPEEEVSDECESTTQPAGELENDADRSRTDQNESSSLLSPAELPTPQEPRVDVSESQDDTTDTSTREIDRRRPSPSVQVALVRQDKDPCNTSLKLSERDSQLCLDTGRCCQHQRANSNPLVRVASGGSCEREHGSVDDARVYTASPGRSVARQAKLASRVRLKRTEEDTQQVDDEQAWCAEAAAQLALDVCAQADLREALLAAAAGTDGCSSSARCACVWKARAARLAADAHVVQCALARATDTAHRLWCACAAHESWSVALCEALRAADRALETYDVLLALAETAAGGGGEGGGRAAAELVARRLLARLDAERGAGSLAPGEPLLSPGPWLPPAHHHHPAEAGAGVGVGVGVGAGAAWSPGEEARLRAHAARLKADTAALRALRPEPAACCYRDIDEEELPKAMGNVTMADMEAAVMMQEILTAREMQAVARAAAGAGGEPAREGGDAGDHKHREHKGESTRSRRRARRHWLDAQPSETDL